MADKRPIEVVVCYKGSNNPNKERRRVHIDDTVDSFLQVKRVITECGIREEAVNRHLGRNIDVQLGRIAKSVSGTKVFQFNTDEGWHIEKEEILNGSSAIEGMLVV